MKRPIVLLVCLWITGYVLAMYIELPWLSLTASLVFTAAAVILYVLRIPSRVIVCGIMLVGASMSYYHWNDQRNVSVLLPDTVMQEDLASSEVTLLGRIASPVTVDGDKAGFTVEAEYIRFPGRDAFPMQGESVQVSLRLLRQEEQAQTARWQRGDALTLQGQLRSPAPARNFGGFDYRRYLRLHRTHWLFTAKGTDQAQFEPASRRVSLIQLLRWNDGLRDALGGRMDHIFPTRHAGFMKSMLIGQQDDLDPQRFQQFSELGLTHILAISGLNVAVFLGVCTWFMRKMRLTKETYLLISILLLPPYILLTGASPSIVRAGLMAMIALYAVRRGILKDALHLTAIVAWLMLLWDPYYLLDVGFQLSFLVTLGLILGVPRVSNLIPLSSTVLTNTLSITIVSQLISFPISIYYFNQFSLLSWVANAILVPIISLVVFPAGLVSLAVGMVYLPLGQGLGWLLAGLNDLIFWSTDQLQLLRGFRMIWPTPSFLWIAAYYALICLLYTALYRRKQLRESAGDKAAQSGSQEETASGVKRKFSHPPYPIEYIPVMLSASSSMQRKSSSSVAFNPYRQTRLLLILALSAFAVLLYIGYTPERWNRHGLVQFMDVGQGDSILIRTPQGRHLLIDGGGTLSFRKPGEEWKDRKDPYEVGRKLLVPLLKKRGVHQLDMVILTHEDMDHSGGLQAVVEQIPVKQFLFNGTYKANDQISKLFGTVLDRTIPLVKAEYGSTIEIEEGTTLQILYPFMDREPVVTLENKQNDQSIVFLLHMGGLNWLFTGDMEKSSEDELLKSLKDKSAKEGGRGGQQSIDVLKIAHHGSKTSTSQAWLDYWKPKTAVISVGESNTYGHPSPEVMKRIQQSDTRIFRTDQMGEVQLETLDGGLYARMKLVDADSESK